MLQITTYYDHEKAETVYVVKAPDTMLQRVEFDNWDRAVLDHPIEQPADILQNLELLARRAHEQGATG